MNQYKFYITHNSITTQVFPVYESLKFSWERDGVRFRRKLKSEFTFVNDAKQGRWDFNTILSIETGNLRCETIYIEIQRSCDRGKSYSTYWNGSFSVNDGKFNLDQCIYTITVPNVEDKYSCIYKKLNDEFNLILSGPLLTIKNITQFNYEFYYCDISGVSQPVSDPNTLRICFPSPSAEEATWTELYTDIDCYDFECTAYVGTLIIYVRERVVSVNVGGISTPPAGSGWVEVSGSNNGETTTYVRPYTGTLPVIDNTIVNVACNGTPTLIGGLSYIKLFFTNLNGNCADGNDWYWSPPNAVKTYTQFRTLYDAIDYLLDEICPDLTLVSDFFEWNPIGDAPDYIAGKNYVTSLTNVVNNLAIAQKSDIIDPNATQHATKGMITLKNLLDNLKTIFNIDWFIDSNDNFRLEHYKYFNYSVGYNSTAGVHKNWNLKNRIYSYKKENMPSKEIFQFMESQNIDFVGRDIIYTSSCVTNEGENNSKQYSADKISTDINFIENQPTDIEKSGFVLAVYESINSINQIAKETGLLTGALLTNAHLSWANLHYNYHRYGRVLLEGNMNGNNETFLSAVRNKVQSNVKLQICCGQQFDPTAILVETELGNGEVESAEQVEDIVTLQINI